MEIDNDLQKRDRKSSSNSNSSTTVNIIQTKSEIVSCPSPENQESQEYQSIVE